jgi:hypothetical protein
MSGNLLVRFDEGRVGRTFVSPSLLLYRLRGEVFLPTRQVNILIVQFSGAMANWEYNSQLAIRVV